MVVSVHLLLLTAACSVLQQQKAADAAVEHTSEHGAGAAGIAMGGGKAIFMPPSAMLYGESLMTYTGAHENDSTVHV